MSVPVFNDLLTTRGHTSLPLSLSLFYLSMREDCDDLPAARDHTALSLSVMTGPQPEVIHLCLWLCLGPT